MGDAAYTTSPFPEAKKLSAHPSLGLQPATNTVIPVLFSRQDGDPGATWRGAVP